MFAIVMTIIAIAVLSYRNLGSEMTLVALIYAISAYVLFGI